MMTCKSSLIDLEKQGQSVWLDYISRALLLGGDLLKLINEQHLKGVTSNPTIFDKAIAKTSDYDDVIAKLKKQYPKDAHAIYEELAVMDIQEACDLLRKTYEEKAGLDGFACLEVSPHLANDSRGTIDEAHRLWQKVARPNAMIKVPGTKAGMPAIRALTADGINVNVTLLFSLNAYRDAALAYLQGLNDRIAKNLSVTSIHSVASFFVSRIDSKLDPKLEELAKDVADVALRTKAQQLIGTIAVANARVAFRNFQEIFKSDQAKKLLAKGAHPQRLLWASTSTKNPNYSDVKYVESLIADNTVNTMPLETIKAFLDHGRAHTTAMTNIDNEQDKLNDLSALGLDLDALCQELLGEGLLSFTNSFDQLLGSINKKAVFIH